MPSKRCPTGDIVRSAFSKRSYARKAYTRTTASGKKVRIPASHVSRSKVGESCVPAKGKAILRGKKTPASQKVLPKLDKKIKLTKFGYHTHESTAQRHAALDRAVEAYGNLKTLRHLNLIDNYMATPSAKKIMRADVAYLSRKYSGSKGGSKRKSSGSKKTASKRRSSSKSVKGGSKRKSKRSASKKGSKRSGSKHHSKRHGSKSLAGGSKRKSKRSTSKKGSKRSGSKHHSKRHRSKSLIGGSKRKSKRSGSKKGSKRGSKRHSRRHGSKALIGGSKRKSKRSGSKKGSKKHGSKRH
jgi:hypothetical protein